MKHVIVNCKTGKTETVDDGLPDIPRPYDPSKIPPEPVWLDIAETSKVIKDLKNARVEIDILKSKVATLEKGVK